MSQQIINLGSGPDTQTGDTISVAFTKVNNNFTELYSVFDGNGITTINANVIFANNIVTSTNVRTGNLLAYGNIESIGYVITAGAFYPNGLPIGSIESINSNLIPTVSNVYTLGSVTRQFSQAYIGSNLTLAGANLTVINGNLYIDNNLASGNYGNANVTAFLPAYSGNLGGTITTANQPNITTVGTLTALGVSGNLVVGGNLRVEGNVTYFNVENLTTEDPIINLNTGANGAPLSFNNGYDSGVKTNYYSSSSRSAFFGRINSSGFFEYYSNVTAEVGNIVSGTYGTIKSANLVLTNSANIAGNVTGNYFLGNGRFLSGIDATSIQNGNSNVKVYANGNVSVTTAGTNTWNFGTTGQLTVPGAILTASASKLDLVGFGPNIAYLTTTADDSTALYMGAAVVDLRALDSISIATNTDETTYTWTFTADGNLTAPGNIGVAGNVSAPYFTGNFSGNFTGNFTGTAANTQVLFSDNNSINGTSGFTFDKTTNLVTIGGTISSLAVNVAGYNVIDSNGNVVTSRLIDSGVVAGTYGNASSVPSVTVDSKGRVTAISNVAVAGVSNVTYDNATSNLTIFTSAGTNYSVEIGVGTADSPIFSGLSVSGNATVNTLTVNTNSTVNGTLSAAGGLQNTPIGNVTPSTAIFTSESVSGNSTVNALTVNASATVGTTLGVTGNISGNGITLTGSLVASGSGDFDGGLQSTPIGNASASTGQFTTVSATGNITGSALTANGSITSGTTLSAAGGIQNTPIGNASASTGQFTTVSATGNITGAGLTVNGSATIGTTLSVASDITVGTGSGGNITGANFISANSFVAAVSFSGPLNGTLGSAGGNSAIVSTLSATSNATVNALTVNNSTTIGSTLGVTGNIVGANIRVVNGVFDKVESATIGNTGTNYTGSTYTATGTFNGPHNGTLGSAGGNTAIVSTLSATGAATVNSLQVNNGTTIGSTLTVSSLATLNSLYVNTSSTLAGNLTVVGNLVVTGNVIASGSNNTFFTDSVIELHTLPNLANLTFNDGKDIGIRFHYYKTENSNAFLGWQNETGYLEWIGSGATEDINANIITGSFGTIKSGELILANATPSTSLGTGALQVNGGASFGGNVYANGVAYFGNATAIALTHPLLVATTTANTYAQIQIQNQSTGGAASSDFIATADDGTDTTKYIDMGINGSGWNQSTWTVSGPRDGYLYTSGVNLTIGTDTVGKTVKIHTGGLLAACVVATFNDATTVSSSSTTGALVLTGGLGVSGAINGGSTLGIVGNATVADLTVNNTATIGSTLGVTGNINGSSLTLTGSEVATGSIQALGGLQNTPIGNASASTGQFTTVSATGNIIGAGLTSNGSITAITTLSALGGIQNTPIGNVTPVTGKFTTLETTSTATVNSLISNGSVTGTSAQFTTINGSANATVNSLAVNNAATIGSTLDVTGNVTASYFIGNLVGNEPNVTLVANTFSYVFDTFGNVLFPGNLSINGIITGVTGIQIVTLTAIGNVTANALTINNTATIGSTLGVTGNINGNGVTLTGSLVARGSGDFDGGLQSTPIGNATASTGQFTTLSATGNITGAALTSNGSITAITTVSALGGLQSTPIGNVAPSTAIFTTESVSGNSTVNGLTVNTSAAIGTTLGVTGNATVGNILAGGFFFANGTPLTTSAGGTSGQVQFNNGSAFAGATYLTYQSGNGRIIANSGITSTSNVSGAIVVSGGVGVTGNVYVSQRVGFVAANSVSVVYQVYNAATNSLDTVFE